LSDPKLPLDEIQSFAVGGACNAWLGVRVLAASDTGVEIEIPWREEFVGIPGSGTMHGGILAAAIDVTAGLSLMAILGRPGPTIDMRVDFHRAMKAGALRGVGRVLRAGGSITSVEAMLYDPAGTLVASGRCVFFTAPR
jgi:uncharacterized protein (TIGR00369 family)